MKSRPVVTIVNDYDGFFAGLVERLIDAKESEGEEFRHHEVAINAGPYRSSAVTYVSHQDTEGRKKLSLDFYSALRTGFGSLSETDRQGLKSIL